MTNKNNENAPIETAATTDAPASAAEKDVPKLTQKAQQKKSSVATSKQTAASTPDDPQKTSPKAPSSGTADKKKPAHNTAKNTTKKAVNKPAVRSGRWLAALAIAVALAAGGGVYVLFQQQERQSAESAALNVRLAEVQASVASQQQQLTKLSQLDTLKQEIDAVSGKFAAAASVRQRIEAEQQALNTALSEMSAKLGRTTVAWRLAEIEYLLITANTRLSLERDIGTALVALQTADQKLRAIGDPVLVPVRQTIALEVTNLKGVQQVDFTGMALTLGSLVTAVDDLPLLDTQPARISSPEFQTRPEEYESLNWADIPAAMWNDIRSLVVVRRVDKPIEPLLPPAEEWYLRQNLKLKLEQARLSLLRHETALFRLQLDEAGQWVKAYFEGDSSAVGSLLESLQALKKVELQPDLPDISDSLRVLRKHMKRLGAEVEAAQREGSEQ